MSESVLFNRLVSSGELDTNKEYWLENLKGVIFPSSFPQILSKVTNNDAKTHAITYTFPIEIDEKVKKITKGSLLGSFSILLSGVIYLLYRYTDQEDTIVRCPVPRQTNKGVYINHSVLIRHYVTSDSSFKDHVLKIRNCLNNAYNFMNYPIENILNQKRQANEMLGERIPVMVSMKGLHNLEDRGRTNPAISFHFDQEDGLSCVIEYDCNAYSPAFMNNIMGHLSQYFLSVFSDLDGAMDKIQLYASENFMKIDRFNQTVAEYPKEKTLQELFEEQAERTPEHVAVICGDERWTYRELNARANRLAAYLQRRGVRAGSVVAVALPRTADFVSGILAVLKAGGLCLPIDPNHPEERRISMLAGSGAAAILTHADAEYGTETEAVLIRLDEQTLEGFPEDNPEVRVLAEDPAFLIYTSGSTGNPKGVALNHRGIHNHARTKIAIVGLVEGDRLGHSLNTGFVASIWLIFAPLMAGATVVVYDEPTIKDPYELFRKAIGDGVGVVEVIPSFLNRYLEMTSAGKPALPLNGLKALLLTGEAVSAALVDKFYARYTTRLINAYGQTECSDDTLHYEIPNSKMTENVWIGRPSHNTRAYVLNAGRQLQPIGAPGELYIAGEGVARGYWNNEELTHERFVPDPFVPGERMYRTGDRARWLENGNVEYLGRMDSQIKIRGYRIEPGEIEECLRRSGMVADAAVLACEDPDGEAYLTAYLTGEAAVSGSEIRRYLTKRLPDHMVPVQYVKLERIPVTANGKVDRESLRRETGQVLKMGEAYAAPTDEIESQLAAIWEATLKRESIGIHDNFFALGGHSLNGTVLLSRIQQAFETELALTELFANPTIAEQAEQIRASTRAVAYERIARAEEAPGYRLTPAQKRIYVLNRMEEGNRAYQIPVIVRMSGPIERERIEQAVRGMIARHETLRTSFEWVNGEPVQRIADHAEPEIAYRTCQEEEIGRLLDEQMRSFQLEQAPLMRVGVMTVAENEHVVALVMHHIVSDGTSIRNLIREFVALYAGKTLPELPLQYKDYAAWQAKRLATESMKRQEAYWLERYADEIPVLQLPIDYPRAAVQSFEGAALTFKLGVEEAGELRRLAQITGLTVYMVLLAAYTLLLSKYSGQEDIVVGSPIAGRLHPDLEPMIGMFVNTLAMRNRAKADQTVSSFLAEVKENALKAFENQEYQFEELVGRLDIRRELSRNPLFDTMFVMQNMEAAEITIPGATFMKQAYERKVSRLDLTLEAVEQGDEIFFTLEYCTKLFKPSTMDRMADHYVTLLTELAKDGQRKLADVEMMNEEERQCLLETSNGTAAVYPQEKTLQELFEEQAERTPEHIAVICGSDRWTYRELNERANRIARMLRDNGIASGKIVGIVAKRSVHMIAGIMGTLKAGAAYLPLDPSYPAERINYMLDDSRTEALLAYGDIREFSGIHGTTIDLQNQAIDGFAAFNLPKVNSPNDAAYVLYTSGSTGRPKGVVVEHRNATSFISGITSCIEFSEDKTMLALTTVSFDIFFLETLLPLTVGMKVVIANEDEQLDGKLLAQLIHKNEVNMLQVTPSRLKLMLEDRETKNAIDQMQDIMIGGEPLTEKLMEELYLQYTGNVYNMYGPTETTIWSAVGKMTSNAPVHIGLPIRGTRLYVMDKHHNLLPIGIPGELLIAGEGVTRGYLNRGELTGERYIQDPFYAGDRMYKTGDMVKRLHDGSIAYIGRIDDQIKLNGYRIELGEIEKSLLECPGVQDAAVALKENHRGNKYLCAYLKGNLISSVEEIRACIGELLPNYMIPSKYLLVDSLPYTLNGKLDRKALPGLAGAGIIDNSEQSMDAENVIESELVGIWKKLLDVESVSTTSNFFEVGGNSLTLIQMHREISEIYPGTLKVAEIFGLPTIRKLAAHIGKRRKPINDGFKSTELPEQYFIRYPVNESTQLISFQLDSDTSTRIDKLVNAKDRDAEVYLVTAFIYLLSALSTRAKVGVQIAAKGYDRLYPAQFHIADVDSLNELCLIVEEQLRTTNSTDQGIHLTEIPSMMTIQDKSLIYPLVYKSEMISDKSRIDISIFGIALAYSISYGRAVQFVLEYDGTRLDAKKVAEMIYAYTNLLKQIAKSI